MPEPTLHHIGFVVRSIDGSGSDWQASLGGAFPALSRTYDDPIQGSRVAFLRRAADEGSVQLELVEPLSPSSPVARFLDKGGGLHHLCFEVDCLEEQVQLMKTHGAVLVRSPQPAVAFGGRRICWMLTRERLLVEYLERAQTA